MPQTCQPRPVCWTIAAGAVCVPDVGPFGTLLYPNGQIRWLTILGAAVPRLMAHWGGKWGGGCMQPYPCGYLKSGKNLETAQKAQALE